MQINGDPVTLAQFQTAVVSNTQLTVARHITQTLKTARAHIDTAAAADIPIYGLNTGLGANLGHRLSPSEITAFQRQILNGRATAVGPALADKTGRAVLLYRVLSAAKGHSGISPKLFTHLVSCFNTGLSPTIPQYGSIGAGDLTQLAPWALQICDAPNAPTLHAKDAMALINHTGLTLALAATALTAAQTTLCMARHALLLTYIGYDANRDVLSDAANALRPAHGQTTCAAWLRDQLQGTESQPRRIQEALSIRTAHTTLGAAQHTLDHAIETLESELNATSDSPALLPNGRLTSTANFHTPALALALDTTTLALTRVANDSLQRIQRLMNPDLTALPKYLSPTGRASAGFVPAQKTAAALLADIQHQSTPTHPPAPVSDSVEDVAPMTPQSATKLQNLIAPLKLLFGLESRTALQAIHLRDPKLGPNAAPIVSALSGELPLLTNDRPLGPEIEKAARLLERL